MKAKVFFITLTDTERDAINMAGWESQIGQNYINARNGKINKKNIHMFELAATTDQDYVEDVWFYMQNGDHEWCNARDIECHTTFPRSMDIGDVIVWEDGRIERCSDRSFEDRKDLHGLFKEHMPEGVKSG